MSVEIIESGMSFGEYQEVDFFRMEKSDIYKSLGDSVKSVEFIWLNPKKMIMFVEAKSSSPKPSNQVDFDEFIDEIYNASVEKFSTVENFSYNYAFQRRGGYARRLFL